MSAEALAPRRPVLGSAGWPHAANAALGLWLATAPATFGPHHAALLWSDVVSGVLILALSALACVPRFARAAWGSAAVGLWLMAAPLVFWAPTAAAYWSATAKLACDPALVFLAVTRPETDDGAEEVPGHTDPRRA